MEVPSHHVKQEVCISRPPYREGRHPKAVKVYTVNNESVYLVIQGVPSVGAGGELNKLCSSFGSVEDFRPLDEYPCEDKYTEVYLIKYKKIQSSRFAKRKLDEHSFFGGNLHVCYAPEYESLQETRDKLRDRRQVVAKKIRQHSDEKAQHQKLRQPVVGFTETNSEMVNSRVPPLPSGESMQNTNFGPQTPNLKNDVHRQPAISSTNSLPLSQGHDSVESIQCTPPAYSSESLQPGRGNPTQHDVFQLPLPPKSLNNAQLVQKEQTDWRHYEYSRVPTAHATLPEGYDGRLEIHECQSVSASPQSSVSKPESIKQHNLPEQPSQIVIKDYKLNKPALKFVPRQAVKTAGSASEQKAKEVTTVVPAIGSHDDNLRKNAFHLGKVQGPEEMPGRKRVLPSAAQQSVNDTISTIRTKISKIIGEKVGKKS